MKINVKKTKSLRLGISEDENVTLGNQKIEQVHSFTFLGSRNSEDVMGAVKMSKSRIVKAEGAFSQLRKVWKNSKISHANKD